MSRVNRSPRLPLEFDDRYRRELQALLTEHAQSLSVAEEYSLIVPCSDEASAVSVGTSKRSFAMPWTMLLTRAPKANLVTAQVSGTIFTVDVNVSGATILPTKITIDNTETTSETAATPAVLSTAAYRILADAIVTIDVDQIGNGTAKGLKVTFFGVRQL